MVKRYGRITALSGLDLTIPSGRLVGFLGPNGAGKTTTFRALLGLAKLDEGSASVAGHHVGTETHEVVRKVGAIVEGPAVYETLTGTDNLLVCARTRGVDDAEVAPLLSRVGLAERAGDKAAGYSKGMRQRLALAMALLAGPEILLLDEPMDGLDPAGQVGVRDLLGFLVEERGTTVVVSSHVLADVERLVDYVVLIHRGKLVTEGPLEDLVDRQEGIRVVVEDAARAIEALEAAAVPARREGPAVVAVSSDPEMVARVLARQGIFPRELLAVHPSLEDLFLRLTAEEPE